MSIVSNRFTSRLVSFRFASCALTAAAILAFLATPAHAIFITYGVPVSSYVALAQQAQYASTVYLADNTSPVGGETAQFCSGILISADVVLTAAH
jgi:secreted trypsin-like serine protease